jgi:hypothetical protein
MPGVFLPDLLKKVGSKPQIFSKPKYLNNSKLNALKSNYFEKLAR